MKFNKVATLKVLEDIQQKKQLNKLVKLGKERGVSPFASMKHTSLPTLFRILDNISPRLHLSEVERIEYKIWDEIGGTDILALQYDKPIQSDYRLV